MSDKKKAVTSCCSTMAEKQGGVPYYVLPLEDGKAKAMFSVPSQLAESLTKHPVVCRGAFFELHLDTASQAMQQQSSRTSMCFLSTEFDSPDPEGTAKAISSRLANRMADTNPLGMSGILGGRR